MSSFKRILFLSWFTRGFSGFKWLFPLILVAVLLLVEILIVAGLAQWTAFIDFIDNLVGMSDHHAVLTVLLLYPPVFLLLGPRSLLTCLIGFLFGFTVYGILVDILGIALGISSIIMVSRLFVLPFSRYLVSRRQQRHLDRINIISPNGQPNEHSYYAAIHSSPSRSMISTWFSEWTQSIGHRISLIQKLQQSMSPFILVAVFNSTPLVPVHFMTYLLSISKVDSIAILTIVSHSLFLTIHSCWTMILNSFPSEYIVQHSYNSVLCRHRLSIDISSGFIQE